MTDEDTQPEKKTCSLDKLPRSAMHIDTLKRSYNDHKKTDQKMFTSDQFKKDFDDEGFTLWRTVYNYNDDFTGRPGFILNNNVNGMIQAMEYARKYAFGKLLLLDAGDSKRNLVGFWVLRGELPLKEVLDDMYEYHTWTKMPLNKETLELFDLAFYSDVFESMPVIHSAPLL